MKHLFVVNPVAGGKKGHIEKLEENIKSSLEGTGGNYEIYVTKAPMDAVEKVKREAKSEDMLYVYACGGDGTLNECVNGAAQLENVAVTHFPCGTGNDFVKMFGAEKDRFFHLRNLISGEVRKLDVIRCNGRYCINICSVGIDARIGTDVHKYSGLPLIGGVMGYIVSLLVNVKKGITRHMVVEMENGERIDSDLSLICVCNGSYYGGKFNPVPEALPDDGLFDSLIVKGVSAAEFMRLVFKYAKGQYRKLGDRVTHIMGRKMKVSADEDMVINVDGEAIFGREAEFELIPGGVNFIVPKNMEYFKNRRELAGA